MNSSDRLHFLTHCFPANSEDLIFKPVEAKCLKFRLVLYFISFFVKCSFFPTSIIIHINFDIYFNILSSCLVCKNISATCYALQPVSNTVTAARLIYSILFKGGETKYIPILLTCNWKFSEVLNEGHSLSFGDSSQMFHMNYQ